MFTRTRLTVRTVPALAVAALVLACAAVALAAFAGAAAAGTGAGVTVAAVEGLPFSGAVAGYTSTATADQRFTAQAYRDLLDRAPASAELAAAADLLANGGTRSEVAAGLLSRDEYRLALARSIYNSYLRRPAGAAEAAFGVSLLESGATDEELRSFVLGSPEYLSTQGGGTVHGFLNGLYQDVLGRPLDSAAEAVFTQALANGQSRTDVALAVLGSSEGRQGLVAALYTRLLHRAASPADLQLGAGLLANGATDEDLTAELVGSQEYGAKVPASFASASIVWGDGTAASTGAVGGGIVTGSHTYAEQGTYAIQIVVGDLDGTTAIAATATVADAPLTAKPVSFAAVKKVPFTQTVATFTDANAGAKATEFRASIVWGDGQSSAGTIVAQTGGGFAVVGTHRYDGKGTYAVAARVADEGGSTAGALSTASVTTK